MPTDMTANAGGGGSAGAGGSGSAGTGGSNSGGSAGTSANPAPLGPPPCTGCVEMDVPFVANTAAIAMYNFVFPATGVDMTNATVTWSIGTLTPSADVYVTPFAQNGTDLNYAGVYRPQTLLTAANGFSSTATSVNFVNVVLDLANTAPFGAAAATDAGAPATDAGADGGNAGGGALLDNGGMDKSRIVQLGLQIGSLATLAAPTTVRVVVDKIDFQGVDPSVTVARDRDFSDGVQELTQNTYMLPAGSTGPTKY